MGARPKEMFKREKEERKKNNHKTPKCSFDQKPFHTECTQVVRLNEYTQK